MGRHVNLENRAANADPVSHTLRGQRIDLYADRALFWGEAATLVVADLHLGKSDTFRSFGIPLPAGTTETNLARLGRLLDRTGAKRLLILGDFLHARAGRTDTLLEQVSGWRRSWDELAIDLLMGNHDRRAGPLPEAWHIQCHEELSEPPFVWRHEPGTSPSGYVIAGHVHPGVRLRGRGEQLTLPCFAFGAHYGVLPAFGDFTGYVPLQPQKGDAYFVLADDQIIRFDA
jgi:DNA ligase-associated metallophosphoesterase